MSSRPYEGENTKADRTGSAYTFVLVGTFYFFKVRIYFTTSWI
jgi:hypothetical protein